jgi:Tol biopolymer transport system component
MKKLATIFAACGIACILAAGLGVLSAQTTAEAEKALESARHKEVIDGDLKAAIEQYKKVIAQRGVSREIVAKALVRLGLCYEKQGSAEARKTYERVTREFADQPEAAQQARARLAAAGTLTASGKTVRQVWTLPADSTFTGRPVSPDGRYIIFLDSSAKNEISLHDVATGSNRRLTNAGKPAPPAGWAFSADGKQLAYTWRNESSVQVMSLQTGAASRVLYNQPDAEFVAPTDWSPDGKSLAVSVRRKGSKTAELGIVSVRDGSFRALGSDLRNATFAVFSPDGKYIAYNNRSAEGTSQDLFVRGTDGGPETAVVVDPANDQLAGWSPDGNYLLFASDRTGVMSLWAQPMNGGKPSGAPVFLRSDIGGGGWRVSSSGALFYTQFQREVRFDIKVASFDFEAERFLSQPVVAVKEFTGSNSQMDWSPDGKYLVAVSNRSGQYVLAVHSADTGALIREVKPAVALTTNQGFGPPAVTWTPDSRGFAAAASDAMGRQGIYRIDAESGAASSIVLSRAGESLGGGVSFSPDGKKIAYDHLPVPASRGKTLVERDLATGIERELLRESGQILYGGVNYSPDGKYFATGKGDVDHRGVVILPLAGGAEQELLRVPIADGFSIVCWAPDSRSVFLARGSLGTGVQIWRVSIDTRELHRVNFDERAERVLRVHPDGHRIAYPVLWEQQPATEVWALENFLPTASGKH